MRTALLLGLVGLSACTPFENGGPPREARPFQVADLDPAALRFVAWNINTVGARGDAQYAAMLDIVGRLQPDVLAISEISNDEDGHNMEDFAEDAGFDHYVKGDASGFGGDRNAVMARYPIEAFGVRLDEDPAEILNTGWTSAALSGDPAALDQSRVVVAAKVQAPGGSIGVIPVHWKSGGTGNVTEFRRAIDAYRTLQGAALFGEVDHVIIAGDYNVDVFDNDPTPELFFEMPASTSYPGDFVVGSDINALMAGQGLLNHPHLMLEDAGYAMQPLFQVDGGIGTRPSSGRTLDYIYATPSLVGIESEIYNSVFDDGSGIDKAGEPLDALACATATDHLPVVVDYRLDGSGPVTQPPVTPPPNTPPPVTPPPVTPLPGLLGLADLDPGDLLVTEFMANPDNCSDNDGEWIELYNATASDVDITGLELRDASENVGVLGALVMAPGEYVVLARSSAACDITPDAIYGSSLSLNNSTETIEIRALGTVIDTISYGSSASEAGLSSRLDASGAWCSGTPSPGSANAGC